MQIETDFKGTRRADFTDSSGVDCSIGQSWAGSPEGKPDSPCIWFGRRVSPIHLYQSHVKALLPLLQHFVETGRLPAGDDQRPEATATEVAGDGWHPAGTWTTFDDGQERCRLIYDWIRQHIAGSDHIGGPIISPSCGDHSLGGACEVVMLLHCNHFTPTADSWNQEDDMMRFLAGLEWEYPHEVEVLWKDEQMDRYRRETITTAAP